jgi:hypothetical protein
MPSPDQFHPEFGYVCPTPRFRRMFGVGFVACAVGMLVGAVGIIALAQRPEMARIRGEVATTVGLSESRAAAPAPAPVSAPAWPRAAVINVPAPAAGDGACAVQNWPYRDDTCLLGTQRKAVKLPDTFAAVPAPDAGEAKAAEHPAASTGPAARKRPKVVHRRIARPERFERPEVEPRGLYGSGAPLTHEQWRYGPGWQGRDGRGWSW